MLLVFVAPLALLVGLLLGGRLDKLAALPLRFGWLVLVVFALQWLLVRVPGTAPESWLGLALIGSAALLVGVALANLRLPGFKIFLAGTLLNLLVMAANGGFMPITPQNLHRSGRDLPGSVGQRIPMSKNILVEPEQARLPWLGDSVVLNPLPFVFSPGDVLIALGVAWFVVAGMQPRLPRLVGRSTTLAEEQAAGRPKKS